MYTINENEIDYIEDNLTNYQLVVERDPDSEQNENDIDLIEEQLNSDSMSEQDRDGIAFYVFESEDAAQSATRLPTIPVYRILNSQSGTHYLTTSEDVAMNLESNFPHFSIENNEEPVFYVFDL